MKKLIVIALVLISPLSTFSQSQTNLNAKTFAEIQTKEMVDFFKLDSDANARILNINQTCANKIEVLQQDKQMPSNVILEGIRYNYDLREILIKRELNEKQLELYPDFQVKSKYNVLK
jgi:hypothetical protein